MFDRFITHQEYEALSARRAAAVRELIIEAMQVPPGYVLTQQADLVAGNALITLRPPGTAVAGQRMITFIHSVNHTHQVDAGQVMYRPTVETLRACASIMGPAAWGTDNRFGEAGVVEAKNYDPSDIATMVRTVVSEVCSQAPCVKTEWKRVTTDEFGKWELLAGEKAVQTVWKSGSRWATLMGTTPGTLSDAQGEAELAHRLRVRSAHQERLAGLGDAPHDVAPEPADAPGVAY